MAVFGVGMQEVQGGVSGEGAVGFLGIVPDEPGGELPVESGKVVGEMLVGLDEAIPQGAVEALVAPFCLGQEGKMKKRRSPKRSARRSKSAWNSAPLSESRARTGTGRTNSNRRRNSAAHWALRLGNAMAKAKREW